MKNVSNIISWCGFGINTDLRIISKIFLLIFAVYTSSIVSYFYFDFQVEAKQNALILEKKYKEFFSQAYLILRLTEEKISVPNPQEVVSIINDMHHLLKFKAKYLIFKSIVILYNQKTFSKKGLRNHSKYYKLLNNISLTTPQLVKKNKDTFFIAYQISAAPELIILGIGPSSNVNKYENIMQGEIKDPAIVIDLYKQYLTQEADNLITVRQQTIKNKLTHYINQYVIGGISLLFCIIFMYLYLRKYTNFKFKDLKIRLENQIQKVEAYRQQVESINKKNNYLHTLLKAKKESYQLYLDFLLEIWTRIQNALKEVQVNEELILNSGNTSHSTLLLKQNLNILTSLEGHFLSGLNISAVNIGSIIKELMTIFNYEILEKEIAFFPEEDKDLWVETDKLLLSLILFHVIENAISRLCSNNFLTIHILKRQGWVKFLIIDEGYGVIPLYRKKSSLFLLEDEGVKKISRQLGIIISVSQEKGINSTSIKIPHLVPQNSLTPHITNFNKTNVIQLADYKK